MRRPIAMGFYPHDSIQLEADVKRYLVSETKIKNVLGAVVPHASYAFSGPVAGATLKAAETDKRNFVILCPNHSGYGSTIAIGSDDWQTPLGVVKVNTPLINEIDDVLGIQTNEEAHKYEHSLEVQLPFLQVMYKDFSIVPICLGYVGIEELDRIADVLVNHIKDSFYIASSDFIHFGPNYGTAVEGSIEDQLKWVKEKDRELIDMICKLDAEGFYHTVFDNEYTVCGFIPITLLILIMKGLGAKQGKLIKHMSSYDTHRDSSFVDYAGIVFD